MKKTVIIMSAFLVGATALSSDLHAQTTATGQQDVAQVQYQIQTNLKTLIKQQGKIEATHEAVVDAEEAYAKTPNDSTYATLLNAVKKDSQAVTDYNTMVSGYQTLVGSVPNAEKTFYEDTPVTNAEMQAGPKGDTLADELTQTEPQIQTQLESQIKAQPSFAEQLLAQQKKLQSVQDRINKEMQTDAVKSNPTAKSQDEALVNALSNAITARRCAMNPDAKGCPPKK